MNKTYGITRTDKKIFDTWVDGKGDYLQYVFSDKELENIDARNDEAVVKVMIRRYKRLHTKLKDFNFYFEPLLAGRSFEDGAQDFLQEIKKLYPLLKNDVHAFLRYLINHNFATRSIDKIESKDPDSDDPMNKYLAFMRLICPYSQRVQERASLFGVANNFFDYCFSPKTFPAFKKLLTYKRYHPIARLLYSVMWNHLAGEGWKEWHKDSLAELKKAADSNKTIVYIAGGCDFYQLIKHGIYNICIIDPMLPSQPAYYAQHWDWFVKKGNVKDQNNRGDRLKFTFDDADVYMERTAYRQKGHFSFTRKSGKVCNIPRSRTQWSVYKNDQRVGTVTFERRYCTQKDFEPNLKKQLLISFNELYYITSINEDDHWKIYPSKFKKNIKLVVKQLRRPLTKAELCNMVTTDELPFSFIRLGTCAIY